MIEALVVSNVLLWLAVVALIGLVVVLTRQIGVLHERVAPAGALMSDRGPRVGETAPAVELADLDGHRVAVPVPAARATLLFFLSPTCPVCRTLLPVVRSLTRDEALAVVYASDGDDVNVHRDYARKHGLGGENYVLSTPLGLAYRVNKLPYAALIDAGGTLRGRGIVNTREHLESLLEAMDRGMPSIQDYLKKTTENAA